MTNPTPDFEQRLIEALHQEASTAMTMTDTPRELRRWKDKQSLRRNRFRITAAVAAAAAVAGILVGLFALGSATHTKQQPIHQPTPTTEQTSSFGAMAPFPSGLRTTSVRGPVGIGSVAFGAVWAAGNGPSAGTLYRLDANSGAVLSHSTFHGPVGDGLPPFRVGNVMLLPVQQHGASGYAVYDSSGRRVGLIRSGTQTEGAGDSTGGWIQTGPSAVTRVDASGHSQQTVHVSGGQISAIGEGAGSLWLGQTGPLQLTRLDATTGAVTGHAPAQPDPIGITVGPKGVYVGYANNTIERIDPATNTATALSKDEAPQPTYEFLAIGPDGNVWVQPTQGGLAVLDGTTLRAVRTMQVLPTRRQGGTAGLAVTSSLVFFSDFDGNRTIEFHTP